MRHRRIGRFECLEPRYCLTVTAVLGDDGDLIVEGDADGPVEIVALDEDTFQVSDNAVVVAAVDGVTDDIRVDLDGSDDAANDEVSIDLAGQAVDRVLAELGNGDNTLLIQNGTVGGSLRFNGGDGDDLFQLAGDLVVQGYVDARMGDGDNTVLVEGIVERSLIARAASGDDVVQIETAASVQQNVFAYLGDGENWLTHGGEIGGRLKVHGGADADLVELLAGSVIERSASISLADGDNGLIDAGIVNGSLKFRGTAGNDSVEIATEATVGGHVRVRLGEGENTFTHAGTIDGNLNVASANTEDEGRVNVNAGRVTGETELNLGTEPTSGGPGCGRRFIGLRGPGFGRFVGFVGRGIRL